MTLLRQSIDALLGKASQPDRLPMSPRVGILGGGQVQNGMGAQLDAYSSVGWLFAVVSRIAEAVAATEWRLYAVRPSDGERKEIVKHPLLDLWLSVNPFYTREEFLETVTQHWKLTGEAWIIIIRNAQRVPVELWPVRPDRMAPVPDRKEFVKGYVYSNGTEMIPLPSQDVIFLRKPHPTNPYRGMGVVQALMPDLENERFSALWNRNFFKNSAEPGGVIELTENLSDADWERFMMRWQEQHRGAGNAHRIAILEGGAKWVERQYTQKDMQFEQSRKLNRDIILGAFGVPLSIMGITETVNRANAESGEVTFARRVVKPILCNLRAALNERLCPLFGDYLEFDFIDPTPEDKEMDLREAVEGYRNGILTRNEARARLNESLDSETGDEYYVAPAASPFGLSFHVPETKLIEGHISRAADDSVDDIETRMRRNWAERLAKEAEALSGFLEQFKSVNKLEVADVAGYNWDWFDRYGPEVVAELVIAFTNALHEASPLLPAERLQTLAAEWAQKRGAQLLSVEGDANLVQWTRNRVNEVVSQALDNGESLGKIQKALREDLAFSPDRAMRVARTETATALGQGQKQAALIDGRQEKRWRTQGDSLVAPTCQQNQGAGWIKIGDPFPTGVDTIPQHVNCRCNVQYRHTPLLQDIVSEVRCPDCGRWLGKNVLSGTDWKCHRCGSQFTV